jgi:CHAT domain-containing protein/tetratricopeptide (TPR) repeat protein
MGKGFGYGKTKNAKQERKLYLDFLQQILKAVLDSKGNPKVVYRLLRTNLDKLDDNFAGVLRRWATAKLSEKDSIQVEDIAAEIGVFSHLILQFPEGNRASNLEIAIAGHETALIFFTRSRFPQLWAGTQHNLGIAYIHRIQGDKAENIEQAIHCLTEALQERTRSRFPELWARTQDNLGNAYTNRIRGDEVENIEQAIHCYAEALQEHTRSRFPEAWAITQNNLGTTYTNRIRGERAENIEQAIHCLTEALQVFTRDSFPEKWAGIQMNLGAAYGESIQGERTENLEQAIHYYTQVLQVFTRDSFPERWAGTQLNLANAYTHRIQGERAENLEQAIHYYTQVLQVFTRDSFSELWAGTQLNLGIAYTHRIRGEQAENLEQAIHCYTQALQVFTPSTFPVKCLNAGQNLGNAAFSRKMWEQAIFGYAAAIDAVEQSRTWATSETRRQEILEEIVGIFQNMVQACVNAGQLDKAIEYVERSRSQRLVDLMASNDLYQGGEIPETVQEFLQQYDRLQQQIDDIRFNNNTDSNRGLLGIGTRSRAALEADNETITALEAQKQQVWEKLRQLDPVLAGEIKVDAPNFAAMQQLIYQPTTAILSFYTTKNDTYIFVLRQNQITLYTCTGQGQETLQAWIRENWLSPYVPREGETKEEKKEREATWYSRMSFFLSELAEILQLNQLIAQHLDGIEELIIVPHLLLHQIPFAALPIQDSVYRYLGDKFLIRYTPSCQVLEFCQQRGDVTVERFHETSLQYGTVEDATDDLACASFEGEQIAELYNIPYQRRLIGSTQATRNNYRQLAKQVQVLHSSHHAQSRLDNPLESKLLLGDGNITLGQLMTPGWRLPNLSDVFLSCCETGLGNPAITDDILTLSTGFLCAGARSVVSTLWAVDDLATALFSIFYYQHRQEGKSRAESLRQAQIKLRSLKKDDLKEIYKLAKTGRAEARNKRNQYPRDSTEYLECDRQYRKYAGVTIQIEKVINSPDEIPFSHPRFWAAFTCSGLC